MKTGTRQHSFLRAVILIFALFGLSIPVAAYNFVVNGIYYNKKSSSTVTVTYKNTNYNSYSGNVNIPSSVTYNGVTYSVITIDENAFRDCSGLTSINIPNSVTRIERYAFIGCSNLTSINIPASITFIGQYAFWKCSGLISATIPNSVTTIENGTFDDCSGLTSITIPSSVTRIGSYAFRGCISLKSVAIPDFVTTIAQYAFAYCENLTTLVIGKSVNEIKELAFSYCNNVRNLSWNATNCLTMGSLPTSNIEELAIGYGVINIPDNFVKDSKITSIEIPTSVDKIGAYAFSNCTELTEVIMGYYRNGIEPEYIGYGTPAIYVGVHAFQNCSSLTTVAFLCRNENLHCDSFAFNQCTNLKRFIVRYPYSVCDAIFGNNTSNPLYYCHRLYCIGNDSLDESNIEEVTSLDFSNLNLTEINNYAYINCEGVSSLSISENISSIGSYAFYGMNNLTSLTWNAINCTTNGDMSTHNIKEVFIGEDVKVLPENFVSNSKITEVNLPNKLTTIGNNAFNGCTNLTSILIPYLVKSIGQNSFNNCSSLKNLIWNANNCSSNGNMTTENIESIEIAQSSVLVLPNYFAMGSKIKTITIPNGVNSIGSHAFSGCNNLTKVKIPFSVGSIGEKAFYDCLSLDTVYVMRVTPPNGASNMFSENQLIYVSDYNKYSNNSFWKMYNLVGMYSIESSLTKCTISSPKELKLNSASLYYESYGIEQYLPFEAINNMITINELLPNKDYYLYQISITIDGQDCTYDSSIRTQPVTFSSLQCSSTQTTLNVSFNVNRDEGFVLDDCGIEGNPSGTGSINETTADSYTIGSKITGLSPSSSHYYRPWVQYKGQKYYGYGSTLYTNSIGVSSSGSVGPTSVDYTASYSAGDAHVTNAYFTFQGSSSKNLRKTGLEPRSNYGYNYTVETSNGNQSNSYSFTTPTLSLVTQVPRMLKNTMPMFIAETNMADIETSCGFEWRRYDAPEEMPSAKVYCPVYGGVMAGTLKNLSENVYYKYRPFYKSSEGNEYYGDWIAFITADAGVEFEPVVYTYDAPDVTQTDATLQGVALRGSEEITEQGFEYWPASKANTLTASNNVTRVTANGERMSKTVTGLQAGTKYKFRAYVIAGGETTYGAEVEFVTLSLSLDVNLDGEVNIADVNSVIDLIMDNDSIGTGDVNGDGEVNIADINTLIDAILSK